MIMLPTLRVRNRWKTMRYLSLVQYDSHPFVHKYHTTSDAVNVLCCEVFAHVN